MVLVLTLSMIIPNSQVMAADLTTKIKVTGIEEGCNVYAYAIAIDAVDANGNHYWKYNPEGSVKYRIEEDKGIVPGDMMYFYMNLNSSMDPEDWDLHDGEGEAVVDKIVLPMTYDANDKSYNVSGVKPGLYVIAANKETKEYSYSGNVVPVNYQYNGIGEATIADADGTIHVAIKKADDPTFKKEVIENGEAKKHGDANIGDVIDFKISITVPDYQGTWLSDPLHYIIKDVLTEGLTLDEDSILVEGTNIKTLFNVPRKHLEKTNYTTSPNGFTLDLYGADIHQYKGSEIEITYQATVNSRAKVNFVDEENKASLRYSTVANGIDLSDAIIDSTYHYTFGFDTLVNGSGSNTTTELTKYGVKTTTEIDDKVQLAGAEFQLFNSNNQLLHFDSTGKFTTDVAGIDHITSKSNGQLTVTGLDAGTYTLKESKAPYGYALNQTTYTIEIVPSYNELTGKLKNYTVKVSGGLSDAITFTHEKLENGEVRSTDNAADVNSFGIMNTPLVTLPETGGAGVIVVTVVAIVMMVGFGSMFILLKKKKQD